MGLIHASVLAFVFSCFNSYEINSRLVKSCICLKARVIKWKWFIIDDNSHHNKDCKDMKWKLIHFLYHTPDNVSRVFNLPTAEKSSLLRFYGQKANISSQKVYGDQYRSVLQLVTSVLMAKPANSEKNAKVTVAQNINLLPFLYFPYVHVIRVFTNRKCAFFCIY